MNKRLFLFALMAIITTGCTVKYYTVDEQPKEVASGNATVTFYYPMTLTLAVPTAPIVVQTNENELVPVGITMSGCKTRYEVSPGKYTFMVGGKIAAFVDVTAAPDKHYYVRLDNQIGYFGSASRYEIHPYTEEELADENVKNSLKWAKLLKMNEDAEKWFSLNKDKLQQKFNDGIDAYKKAVQEGTKKEVLPEDGIDLLF